MPDDPHERRIGVPLSASRRRRRPASGRARPVDRSPISSLLRGESEVADMPSTTGRDGRPDGAFAGPDVATLRKPAIVEVVRERQLSSMRRGVGPARAELDRAGVRRQRAAPLLTDAEPDASGIRREVESLDTRARGIDPASPAFQSSLNSSSSAPADGVAAAGVAATRSSGRHQPAA